MSNFSKATRQKLRFQTTLGNLLVEDVWDLSLQQLNQIAKALKKEIKTSENEEDFLNEKTEVDEKTQLRFDIVIEILNIKKAEAKEQKEAYSNKAKLQKLYELLERKQNAAMENLSTEEIQAQIDAITNAKA
jgi:hypothetical protein